MRLDSSRLATTLCVALANRDVALFAQIGDGIVAVESDSGVETVLIEPKDHYANTTWFIQSDEGFEESFRTVMRRGITAFALSTDGMSYKITNIATGEAYEPFFRGSWQHVRSGASADNFAALLRGIEDDQTGDDKTMVLAALRGSNGTPPPPHPTVSASPPPPGGHELHQETVPMPTAPGGRDRRWWQRRRRT
jgi:hypothetical protein